MNHSPHQPRPRLRRAFVQISALGSALFFAVLSGCKPASDTASNANPTQNTTVSTDANTENSDSIVIGHYGSLTGTTATFGTSADKGIRMAFDEINAGKPPLGKKLELVTEDDGSKTEQVPAIVNKLISNSNVTVLIGEVASSRSKAGAPIAQKAGVPMVSPASTNPEVTKIGDYIFRACFIDPFQGPLMATFASKTLKFSKVAILTDVKSDYSKGLTEVFTEAWEKNGGTIVATASYSEGDKDFQSQLTKIKAASPQAIFIPGYYTEVSNIAKQARRLGIGQPLFGCDGWDSPELVKIGGKALDGCYFSTHFSIKSKSPKVVKFVDDFKAKFGESPDAMAALGYDTAFIVSNAIERAGEVNRSKIRDAIAQTKGFEGVTGTISLDKERNAVKPAVVIQIQNREENYVTTIKP